MLAGIPVAVSDFPELRDVAVGERCGVTYDPENPESIAEAIGQLMRDPKEARAMGKRGKALIASQFHWERGTRELVTRLDAYRVSPRRPS